MVRQPALTWRQQLAAECELLANRSTPWFEKRRPPPCGSYRQALSSLAAAGLPIPGPWDPSAQVEADSIQRTAIQRAMLLASSLNRTLILPRLLCVCDRAWWLTEQCRLPGASMELPFECPPDVLFTTSNWRAYNLSFRDHHFLERQGAALSRGQLQLPPTSAPLTSEEVARLNGVGAPRVLSVQAADVMRICMCGAAGDRHLQYAVATATSNPVQYCAMERQPYLWSSPASWDARTNPRNCSVAGVVGSPRVFRSCSQCKFGAAQQQIAARQIKLKDNYEVYTSVK